MAVSENQLTEMLTQLLSATTTNQAARKAAVRWFNRLYFDFKRWSDTTFASIRSHKALTLGASAADIKDLELQLQNLEGSLYYSMHERRFRRRSRTLGISGHTLQSELCDNLELLGARFERDFAWLREENARSYSRLEELIGMAEHFPGSGLEAFQRMFASLHEVIRSAINDGNVDRNKLLAALNVHEHESRQAIQKLHKVASEARIELLSVAEYQAVLDDKGSASPDIMVIGEISMSKDTITVTDVIGPVNIKSRLERVVQTVNNAPALPDKEKEQLADLMRRLEDLLVPISEKQPEDAQRVLQAAEIVVAEVGKQKPNKSFLSLSAEGLKEAAKAVAEIAPSVLVVAREIAAFVNTPL